ncbi:hypothetical protein LCGC14_1164330 [marine sediment metagenome]|uniref:Uncharacterized protein n=1 Tax=marine sediment metagenome TaxID=412755 RepID=A0A0F9P9Y8_9ZZZZ
MEESRLITLKTVTGSGEVSETPCLIYSICGIGIADAANVYGIHNGHGTSDTRRFRLVAGSYDADFRLFSPPVFFSKGLYVDFNTGGSEVTVQFLKLAR